MIDSGTVSIEDGVKSKEEYAPARKVKVDLHFSVPEGGDPQTMLDAVAQTADNKVREMLGRPTVAVQAPKEVVKVDPVAAAADKKKTVKAETPKVKEKTKDDLAREAGVLDESDAPPPKPKDEDDLGDLLGDSVPAPVTDAELGKAVQEKNGKEKSAQGDAWAPAKIRELIAKFSDGKRINDIPAAKRPEFLTELAKLK